MIFLYNSGSYLLEFFIMFAEFNSLRVATVFFRAPPRVLPLKRFVTMWTEAELQQKMPVLNYIIKKYISKQLLKGCAILSVQHSLGTMLPVIRALKALGAEELFLLGKSYSECQDAVEEMKKINGVHYYHQEKQTVFSQFIFTLQFSVSVLWNDLRLHVAQNKKIKRVIVLDHGGYAMTLIPRIDIPIVSIEKTTSGINKSHHFPFPRIEMATSAVKRKLESPFIAQAITRKLISQSLLPELDSPVQDCAVIGYGAIGSALAEHLIFLGHRVFIYDTDPSKMVNLPEGVIVADSLSMAVAYSKIIFGCTGTDITERYPTLFAYSPSDKILVSTSSDDIEFLSLLRRHQLSLHEQVDNPIESIEIENSRRRKIRVLNGGFPANFYKNSEVEPPGYVQLTRSLLVASVIQAAKLQDRPRAKSYMLDPDEQVEIARNFIAFLQEYNPKYPHLQEYAKIFSEPNAVDWIIKNSGGKIFVTEQVNETAPGIG